MAIAAMSSNARVCVKAKPTKSKVSFSVVQVRMYPITIGHNPGGIEGPPLSLSWNYTSLGKASVEEFEMHRKDPCHQRRDLRTLYISPQRRVGLLRQAGYSDKQIYAAQQEADKERELRNECVQEAIAQCRAKRTSLGKKSTAARKQLKQAPPLAEANTAADC